MKYAPILILTLFFYSCAGIDTVPLINKNHLLIDEDLTKLEYSESKNIKYGKNDLQLYDLHLPKGLTKKVPVIVLLHSGGWVEGDKGFNDPIVDYLKQKKVQCAIVNFNHRLTFQKGVTYKEQLEDIDLLLKKLQSEAESSNLSPEFFLLGMSAGGHLAMLYAYSSDDDKLVEVVGGIVSPSDLTSSKIRKDRMNTDITRLIGKPYENNAEEYQLASPYFHVKRSSPPTIVFYAGKDPLIPEEQGIVLNDKLKEKKVKHEYYFDQNQGHNWGDLPKTLDKMILFAEKHL